MGELFAEIAMMSGALTAWILVGVIAGWLAGLIMQGDGYGVVGDLVLGLLGAFVGGFVVSQFLPGEVSFGGSVLAALINAVALVGLSRLLTGPRPMA